MERQEEEIDRAIAELVSSDDGRERLDQVLNATIGEALNHTKAALRQYDRREHPLRGGDDPGKSHAELHTLLLLAHEAVCTSKQVTRLFAALGRKLELPPDTATCERLRTARNLLAEHRGERVLYWRLTGEHTEHVTKSYARLGVDLPTTTIDVETFYSESELGTRWGTVGHLLSLPRLHEELVVLAEQLEALQPRADTERSEPQGDGQTVTLRFEIVGPISVATS